MISRCLSLLVFALVSITVWGCGDDENDFLVSRGSGNSFAATSGTGSLLFSFATAQAAVLPSPSAELVFQFYQTAPRSNDREVADPLFESDQPFAPSVTVTGVPTEASYVRITVYNASGQPLAVLTDEVSVRAGQSTPVDLSDARIEAVEAAQLQLLPRQARLRLEETLQLEVLLGFSNGDLVALMPEQISARIHFEVDAEGIVEIDSRGRVAPLSSGLVTITASNDAFGSSTTRLVVDSPESE